MLTRGNAPHAVPGGFTAPAPDRYRHFEDHADLGEGLDEFQGVCRFTRSTDRYNAAPGASDQRVTEGNDHITNQEQESQS